MTTYITLDRIVAADTRMYEKEVAPDWKIKYLDVQYVITVSLNPLSVTIIFLPYNLTTYSIFNTYKI